MRAEIAEVYNGSEHNGDREVKGDPRCKKEMAISLYSNEF